MAANGLSGMNPTQSGTGFLSFNSLPPRLIVTAEDEEFDERSIKHWQEEGYDVTYLPMGEGGKPYVQSLRAVTDELGKPPYVQFLRKSDGSQSLEKYTLSSRTVMRPPSASTSQPSPCHTVALSSATIPRRCHT